MLWGFVVAVFIVPTSLYALSDGRVGLHQRGGMTSFIDQLKSLEGEKTSRLFNLRRDAAIRFIDSDTIANSPKFPADLQLVFNEIQAQPEQRVKAYCMSDLHCDAEKNQRWVKEHCGKSEEDIAENVFSVMIIPGDIGSEVDRIESIFQAMVESHDAVCYVPGNHEAWRRGTKLGDSTSATTPELRTSTTTRMSEDSVQKIVEIVDKARECGVHTGPVRIVGKEAVSIFPLYSWYHSGWDTEPDLEHEAYRAVEEAMPFSRKWGDFSMCTWPTDLLPEHQDFASTDVDRDSTVLALAWASLNEPFLAPVTSSSAHRISTGGGRDRPPRVSERDTVLSFSHFIPRQELLPEKRFLTEPLLTRVVGSDPLEAQIRRLRPHLHLFGHSHVPVDLEVEGIRYVQWPLGYSREANMQCAPMRRHGNLMVYDSDLVGEESLAYQGVPRSMPSLECAWSEYYRSQPRQPGVIGPLAPWVMQRLEQFSGFVKREGP